MPNGTTYFYHLLFFIYKVSDQARQWNAIAENDGSSKYQVYVVHYTIYVVLWVREPAQLHGDFSQLFRLLSDGFDES